MGHDSPTDRSPAPTLSRNTESERTLKDNVRRLLQEISEELCKTIGESSELSTKLHDLEQEGYLLNLILDCRQADAESAASDEADVSDRKILATGHDAVPEQLAVETDSAARNTTDAPAEFRIDAKDLAFLRSVGIDPTRSSRSKRRRKAETAP